MVNPHNTLTVQSPTQLYETILKRLILDLDGTITDGGEKDYRKVKPRDGIVERIIEYHRSGFTIVIHTARNMNSLNSSIGRINVITLPLIMEWLQEHQIPFDEIIVGKPWCGTDGFYVDDRAVRPSEFLNMSYAEIQNLLENEQ